MIPLSEIVTGRTVIIKDLHCGKGLNKRLCDLGFYSGNTITVQRNDKGPMIIKVFDSNIAIGKGQAQQIMVEEHK